MIRKETHQHFRRMVKGLLLIAILCNLTNFLHGSDSTTSCKKSDRIPGKVWMRYASPEQAGWSSEKLRKAKEFSEKIGSAAVMIVYDGAVVDEWGETSRRFKCHSLRKSLLHALYGIYVGSGKIDLQKTLEELGIDDVPPLTKKERQARVVDLLCSRSGIYHPAAYETKKMVADRPERGSHKPGEFFWYNNWDFNALLMIFEKETGKKIFEEFDEKIARPLGMQDFRVQDGYYRLEKEKSIHPAYPLNMSARDLARFGLLYLRRGRWSDKQIFPESWIDASTRSHVRKDHPKYHAFGYGYLWWTVNSEPFKTLGMYNARGVGGQEISVLPEANLVIVHRVNTFNRLEKRDPKETPQVDDAEYLRLIGMILEARTGRAKEKPRLVPLEESQRPQPKAAAYHRAPAGPL